MFKQMHVFLDAQRVIEFTDNKIAINKSITVDELTELVHFIDKAKYALRGMKAGINLANQANKMSGLSPVDITA